MTGAAPFPPGLLAVAAVIVLLKTWHGWRLGVVRQVAAIVALAAGAAAAFFAGPIVAPTLAMWSEVPEDARLPLARLITGLVVYLVISLGAALVFKKTEHQSWAVVRWSFGAGGAAIGFVEGVVFSAALTVAFLAATGRPEIFNHLRALEFEKALDSAMAKPDNEPGGRARPEAR